MINIDLLGLNGAEFQGCSSGNQELYIKPIKQQTKM